MGNVENLVEQLQEKTTAVQEKIEQSADAERQERIRRTMEERQKDLQTARSVLPRIIEELERMAHMSAELGHNSTSVCIGNRPANTEVLGKLLGQWAASKGFCWRLGYKGFTIFGPNAALMGNPCHRTFTIEW